MYPIGQQVAEYLGRGDEPALVALAGQHLPMVRAAVFAYTRGKGFTTGEPDDALEAVIISSCARSCTNPQQDKQHTVGPFSVTPGMFSGWTLPELSILHAYRKRAA